MQDVEVNLSDKEMEILKSLDSIEGENGEKLRNLYRYYLSSIPELRSKYYELKRYEDKKYIEELLKDISYMYKQNEAPTDIWESDRLDKLISRLNETNILDMVEGVYTIQSKFRDLFKMLLHDIATENKDMDEHDAALIAVIQLLKEFGTELDKETVRDAAILLNEGWLYIYAKKMREARESLRNKKLKLLED